MKWRGAVVVGALVFGAWSLWPSPAEQSVRPEDTRRAQDARTVRTGTAEAEDDERTLWRVFVDLSDPTRTTASSALLPELRPDRFFPTLDEAPFPDSESAELLQAVLDGELDEAAFLEAFEDEDWRPGELVDDPWAGLVALEAERLRQRAAVDAEWDVWWEHWEATGEPVTMPTLAYDELLGLADELVDAWPDDPVADFAQLYALHALREGAATTTDPDGALSEALDVLSWTDDRLVLEAAVGVMSELRVTLDNEDRTLLDEVYADLEHPEARYRLARFAARDALAVGDWDDADIWTERQLAERAHTEVRKLEPAHELVGRRGRLDAITGAAPSDWRSALVSAAWTCWLDGEVDEQAWRLQVRIDEGWAFGDWSESGALTACVEDEVDRRFAIPDESVVELELVRR